jgi:hypothetical protein
MTRKPSNSVRQRFAYGRQRAATIAVKKPPKLSERVPKSAPVEEMTDEDLEIFREAAEAEAYIKLQAARTKPGSAGSTAMERRRAEADMPEAEADLARLEAEAVAEGRRARWCW